MTLWRPWYRMIQWSASLVLLLLLLGWVCAGTVSNASDGAAGVLRVRSAHRRWVCAHGASAGRATDAARNGWRWDSWRRRRCFFQLLVWSESLAGTILGTGALGAGLAAVVGHGGDGGGLGLAAGACGGREPVGNGIPVEPRWASPPAWARCWSSLAFRANPFLAVARVVALGGGRAGAGRGGRIAGYHRPVVKKNAPRTYPSAAALGCGRR